MNTDFKLPKYKKTFNAYISFDNYQKLNVMINEYVKPKEPTTEEKVRDLEVKVILNQYFFYVRDCIEFDKEILTGDDWYNKIYKKR